jgi:hypothetical protein
MTVKDFYINVEQNLQSIGMFAYGDILKEEMDIHVTTCLFAMIDSIITPPTQNLFEVNQRFLDMLEPLYVTNSELNVTQISSAPEPYYKADLTTLFPKYLHLLQDRSRVGIQCYVNGVSTYSYKINPNRLTKISELSNVLSNSQSSTAVDQPVSNLADGILRVYYNGFIITKVYIDYIKKPAKITYSTTKSGTTSNTLPTVTVANADYLVKGMTVTGTGIPANTTILSVDSETQFTLSNNATASGVVTLTFGASGATNLPLTESGCYELLKRTVIYLASILEQNQQKIVNLSQ